MKNSGRHSVNTHPNELPLMACSFARRIRDSRFQLREKLETNKSESCFSDEGNANSLRTVEQS
jgi:hypothetical protein